MKNFFYNINLYAQIKNYFYARKTLKEIVKQKLLQDHYFLEDHKGNPLDNPIYASGEMIIEFPLPPNTDESDIEEYLKDHSKVLFDTLLKLDLYGIVNIDKKIFLNDEFSEETDDYGALILLISADKKRLIKTALYTFAFILMIITSIYMLK